MADSEADDSGKISRRDLVKSPWNSLEAAKLGVDMAKGIALPSALAYVGYAITRTQKADEALVAKRIASLDVVAPKANDILCFTTVVGHWSRLTPAMLIEAKRIIDKEMWTYLGVWPEASWSAYRAFIGSCFKEYSGRGAPARIYSNLPWLRSEMGNYFQPDWVGSFEDVGGQWNPRTITERYQFWMRRLRHDMSAAA
jgi:hypothetical protein